MHWRQHTRHPFRSSNAPEAAAGYQHRCVPRPGQFRPLRIREPSRSVVTPLGLRLAVPLCPARPPPASSRGVPGSATAAVQRSSARQRVGQGRGFTRDRVPSFHGKMIQTCSNGTTDARMRAEMAIEAIGSASCHPKNLMSREDIITPTDPKASGVRRQRAVFTRYHACARTHED